MFQSFHIIGRSGGVCPAPPLWGQILSFSHSFLAKSIHVEGPGPPNGSTPPHGKSWIRHCIPSGGSTYKSLWRTPPTGLNFFGFTYIFIKKRPRVWVRLAFAFAPGDKWLPSRRFLVNIPCRVAPADHMVSYVIAYIIGLCHRNGYVMISFDVTDITLGCDIIIMF